MSQLILAESNIDIASPKALADFANTLKQFVVENNLYTPIKDKNYVHVEGWQFAGASLGIFPIVEKVENLTEGTELKYRSEVKLVRISTGDVVGYGVAICSNKEQKKKSFDEYAIASMAQTRATGKAFRLSLGWIMKLAGYEPTTAEEMEDEPITATTELPFEDVKMLVDIQLIRMETAEKIKFLKEYAGTISDKKLSDQQYRALLMEIQRRRDESASA